MWVQIAILVASYLISSATSAKAPKPKPEALTSEDLPQTEDGTGHYVIFGDVWIEDWIVLGPVTSGCRQSNRRGRRSDGSDHHNSASAQCTGADLPAGLLRIRCARLVQCPWLGLAPVRCRGSAGIGA